ncbi:MAG TPA: hypothetical protein VKD47_00520 [Miltoncostaeaceae bacterium]|nr:hypothetical protein [Miltoncostaeaceae bacterium]
MSSRRGGPPALRVDGREAPPVARIALGPRGIGLAEAEAPEGAELAPGPVLRVARGVPAAGHEIAVVAGGRLALAAAPGVARTLRLPDLEVLFDRRPPGLARVQGAALANAGLLLDDAGWRAVVLPSLGDLASDLGPGPVALRADARRIAVVAGGELTEYDLPSGEAAVEGLPVPDAIAYADGGRLVTALGATVGAPAADAGAGSPVVALAAAPEAPLVLARHADGSASLWDLDAGARVGGFAPPIDGPLAMSLSPDGSLAALGTPFATPAAACVVRARDGALVRRVEDARAIAFTPAGGLLVGGEWGMIALEPPVEET